MKNRICMKQLSAVIIQHPGNHVQNLNEKLAYQDTISCLSVYGDSRDSEELRKQF